MFINVYIPMNTILLMQFVFPILLSFYVELFCMHGVISTGITAIQFVLCMLSNHLAGRRNASQLFGIRLILTWIYLLKCRKFNWIPLIFFFESKILSRTQREKTRLQPVKHWNYRWFCVWSLFHLLYLLC